MYLQFSCKVEGCDFTGHLTQQMLGHNSLFHECCRCGQSVLDLINHDCIQEVVVISDDEVNEPIPDGAKPEDTVVAGPSSSVAAGPSSSVAAAEPSSSVDPAGPSSLVAAAVIEAQEPKSPEPNMEKPDLPAVN